MRIILADLRVPDGFASKDTVAGGYGSRLRPFSRVTRLVGWFKRHFLDVPSVQLAYCAAIAAQHGHEVVYTRGELCDGDCAIVLSSLIDYRRELAWAARLRTRGPSVGFIGLAASNLPQLFDGHADFVIRGEPEAAMMRLARGERLTGVCVSPPVAELDALPLPAWKLLDDAPLARFPVPFAGRPLGGGLPLLASRSCPEFCTYCPHRILAPYRRRSIVNIADEIQVLCDEYPRPYLIFRDPLFTHDRDRCLALSDELQARGVRLRFECETRLDRLDTALLDRLHQAGLRAVSFGVESASADTLRRVGRRPTPAAHEKTIVEHCRRRGIVTAAFYVLGFLQDDWNSIAATIDYSIELGSTFAQFKVLTPYPGTPLWNQLGARVFEDDWEKFDGFTPTFVHPNLTAEELRLLLATAYARFYMRPSYLTNYCRIRHRAVRRIIDRLDRAVWGQQAHPKTAATARAPAC